jgi:hypothetical protein
MKVTNKAGQVIRGQAQNLEQVERRFKRWRERRKRGERIPQALWAAAVGLAREYGLERIAQQLQLNDERLKKRLEDADDSAGATDGEAKFVELIAPATVGLCECMVELENARGAKMKIQLKGGALAGLATLSSGFWSAP